MTDLPIQTEAIPGAMPAFRSMIEAGTLRAVVEKAKSQKARLVALWGSDETVRGGGYALQVALAVRTGLLWLTVPLAREHPRYPGIADIYPAANRMQRAAYDLLGIHAQDAPDHRKWLRHRAWPGGATPRADPLRAITLSSRGRVSRPRRRWGRKRSSRARLGCRNRN